MKENSLYIWYKMHVNIVLVFLFFCSFTGGLPYYYLPVVGFKMNALTKVVITIFKN